MIIAIFLKIVSIFRYAKKYILCQILLVKMLNDISDAISQNEMPNLASIMY